MTKNNNTISQPRCVLIIPRKELIDHLKAQIERGKQVAQMPVAFNLSRDYYGRVTETVYDKAQEDEFNNERKKWQKYVEELLKQSFSITNNDYHKDFY